LPIVPIDPTPTLGSDNFPAVEGFWLVGQFDKFFAANGASTLTKAEVEQFCNNEESVVTP